MTNPFSINDRILFGAAFYDEYRRVGSLDRDLDLMVDASFSVIRVGESVWSTWEPSPGVFHLDWLEPVLDGAHERGIDVILGTPQAGESLDAVTYDGKTEIALFPGDLPDDPELVFQMSPKVEQE